MRSTRERIEALRDDHADAGSAPGFDKAWCNECNGYCWPCDHYLALTLALEADTLRTALERLLAATHHAFHAPVAGTGDAEAMVAAYEAARVALGGEKMTDSEMPTRERIEALLKEHTLWPDCFNCPGCLPAFVKHSECEQIPILTLALEADTLEAERDEAVCIALDNAAARDSFLAEADTLRTALEKVAVALDSTCESHHLDAWEIIDTALGGTS